MKRVGQFLLDLLPVILFYLVVIGVIAFGVLKHPEQWIAVPVKTADYLPTGPDTVPNKISCQFRGQGFCNPTRYDI